MLVLVLVLIGAELHGAECPVERLTFGHLRRGGRRSRLGKNRSMSATAEIDLPPAKIRAFTPEGTQVLKIEVGDVENETPLGFVLLPQGNFEGAFRVDGATGDVEVNNPSALDPAKYPRFELMVEVTDGESKAMVGVAIQVEEHESQAADVKAAVGAVPPGLQKLRSVFECLETEISQGGRPLFAGLNLDEHGLFFAGITTSNGLPAPFSDIRIDVLDRDGQSVLAAPLTRKSGEEGEFGAEITPFVWSGYATPLTIRVSASQAGWGSAATKIKTLNYAFDPESIANSPETRGIVGRVLRPE